MSADAQHETPVDNDYASRPGQSEIPVQKDEADVVDPIDPTTADSDETLGTSCHNYLASQSYWCENDHTDYCSCR